MAAAGIICYIVLILISIVFGGQTTTTQHSSPTPSASQQISKSIGYKYPVPKQGAASLIHSQQSKPPPPPLQTHTVPVPVLVENDIQQQPISSSSSQKESSAEVSQLEGSAATPNITKSEHEHEHHHHHHNPVIETIDVACGKERMTVRVTFDQIFNGIIYAKGHYNNPTCQFVTPNSGAKMYQFDLKTGECGVTFIDAGLNEGGQAYVEGFLILINEPGVQEAWDVSRKIRCLWEGNLEQTVTFPLSLNILDSKLLTFSGDTANVALEIQAGVGPRAPIVQGLVGIGDRLTAVIKVEGDTEFDLLVRNCVATDGSLDNRIILTDSKGCAMKPKLMSGWTKEKSTGNVLAFSEISAFKFPDVMDLFLECSVSLCKGDCEECPNYLTLHVPTHDDDTESDVTLATAITEVNTTTVKPPRTKRDAHAGHGQNNAILHDELKLRKVVHVIGPDDLPELIGNVGPTVYGNNLNGNCPNNCIISIIGIILAGALTLLIVLIFLAVYGTFRRKQLTNEC